MTKNNIPYKIIKYPAHIATAGALLEVLPKSGDLESLPVASWKGVKTRQLRIPVGITGYKALTRALLRYDAGTKLTGAMLLDPLAWAGGSNGSQTDAYFSKKDRYSVGKRGVKREYVSKKSEHSSFSMKMMQCVSAVSKYKSAIAIALLSACLAASILIDRHAPTINLSATQPDKQVAQSATPEQTSVQQTAQTTGAAVTPVVIRQTKVPNPDDYYHILMGDKNAPPEKQLSVFVDPNCVHCQSLEPELMFLASNGWRITQYPVAVINDESISKVAGLFCSKTPGNDFIKLMQGVALPVALYGTDVNCKEGAAAPSVNTALLQSMGMTSVPVIIRNIDGMYQTGAHSAAHIEQWTKSQTGEMAPGW